MKGRRCRWCFRPCFLLLCFVMSSGAGDAPPDADSLDSIIRHHAFEALVRGRTGTVYDVPLPGSLSGVKAAVVRLTSRTLWLDGVGIGSFRVPPGTMSVPPVRRLIVVCQDLGVRSGAYYKVQNYSLATPVLGLLAYDVNGTGLGFYARGDRIAVSFPKVDLPRGMEPGKARCITFGPRNSQRLANATAAGLCSTGNVGHFSIGVPGDESPVPSPAPKEDGLAPMPAMAVKKMRWAVGAIAAAAGVVGLIVLCLFAVAVARLVKRKKVEAMGRKAEEGEVLETVWVGGSKMPSASMMRTQPVLENGSPP